MSEFDQVINNLYDTILKNKPTESDYQDAFKIVWDQAISRFSDEIGRIPRSEFGNRFYEARSNLKLRGMRELYKEYYG